MKKRTEKVPNNDATRRPTKSRAHHASTRADKILAIVFFCARDKIGVGGLRMTGLLDLPDELLLAILRRAIPRPGACNGGRCRSNLPTHAPSMGRRRPLATRFGMRRRQRPGVGSVRGFDMQATRAPCGIDHGRHDRHDATGPKDHVACI
ncbi:hypothetical protein pclt_cds_995 [Pandoravirus celtis]|uniref:F-box domain-containing protein n=1 Tax=Pandoravirus celtis TaxID=2568002 RepID=A0A4D6EIC9_9VIRU|nr:hypothetical protein pclt_cds_995 [Pandoravirus celtis]